MEPRAEPRRKAAHWAEAWVQVKGSREGTWGVVQSHAGRIQPPDGPSAARTQQTQLHSGCWGITRAAQGTPGARVLHRDGGVDFWRGTRVTLAQRGQGTAAHEPPRHPTSHRVTPHPSKGPRRGSGQAEQEQAKLSSRNPQLPLPQERTRCTEWNKPLHRGSWRLFGRWRPGLDPGLTQRAPTREQGLVRAASPSVRAPPRAGASLQHREKTTGLFAPKTHSRVILITNKTPGRPAAGRRPQPSPPPSRLSPARRHRAAATCQ